MKTFKALCGYNYEITEHEVIGDTAKFITYLQKDYSGKHEREVRELKESSSLKHFSNYNDAKQWLMDQLDIQIRNAQAQVDRLKSQKQKVNNL